MEEGTRAGDLLDVRTAQVRILDDLCPTCVFHPGNRMHLAPGGLRDLVARNRRTGSALTCHSTLPLVRDYTVRPAMCRGWFDRFGPGENMARLIAWFGRVFVPLREGRR